MTLAGWATGALASSAAEVRSRGTLVVLSFPHPKSEFIRRLPDGGFEGLDYDLMRSFARTMGVELEILPTETFDRLIPDLLAGKGDVIASSFSITPGRRELVDFSEPYFPVLLMAVTRKGSPIASIADLQEGIGCVVAGSSQQERLDAMGVERHRFVERSSDCWNEVAEGRADFAVLDSTAVLTNLENHPTLQRAFDLPDRDEYGFAVAPGSDLRAELDRFLAQSRSQGFFYRLVERHFGPKGVELFRLVREGG